MTLSNGAVFGFAGLLVVLAGAAPASAKPIAVYVFPPPSMLQGTARAFTGIAAANQSAVAGALAAVQKGLDECPGVTVIPIDPAKKLPADFGSEAADAFVTVADGTPPTITVTVDSPKSRARLGSATFAAGTAAPADLCGLLGHAGGNALNPDPIRSDRYFDIVPDADTDRPFADLLLFRLREFGFDGQLTPDNFGPTIARLGDLCGTKRRLFRYHVMQDTSEQKNQGSSTTTTAIGGSVLACNQNDSVDTMYAAPKTEKHFISFGTLVSALVGLAVTLKPKLSTPQLTASEPLFANLINGPDTLAKSRNDAVSEGFRVMLCRYTKEREPVAASAKTNLDVPPSADQTIAKEYKNTYKTGACSPARTSRKFLGLF